MSIPKLGTSEWGAEVAFYINATEADKIKQAKKHKMKLSSYERRMRERGVGAVDKEHNVVIESTAPPERIPYPNLDIKPFKPAKSSRDEEDLNIVIADPHIDKITETYNLEICKSRFDRLLDSVMTIINLHRPIRQVNVFMLGDITQGENAFQGSKIGETGKGVMEQIFDDAIPIISRFLTSLSQGVERVDAYGVRGNHGRYAKEAPDKTNWDTFFYKVLESAMGNQKSVNVYPSRNFYQLVNIRGFRFFLIHGDQVNATAGIPLFAMRRKMQEWFAYVGGFNYAYCMPPETLIWRPDGTASRISQVWKGANVISGNNEVAKVTKVYKRDYEGDLISLKLRGLPWRVRMTPEHRVYTRRQSVRWVEAGEVKVGDCVGVASHKSVYKKYKFDDGWCKLLGYYLAEGWAGKNQVVFGLHEKEVEIIEEIQTLLLRFYGKRGATVKQKGSKGLAVRICSKKAMEDLLYAGGHLAGEKRLSKEYMFLPVDQQWLILDRWLKGDGYKRKGDYQGYSISETLIRQMTLICWRLGYHATISVRKACEGHRESYTLSIPLRDWNGNRWRKHSARNMWFHVTDIKREYYRGEVYNLEVTHSVKSEPSYVAGGIVVHNCGHFHSEAKDQVNSVADYTICPPLVTGDSWALEKVGRASEPKQICFGVHDHYGRTFNYQLHTDDAFLPHKYNEPEGEVSLSKKREVSK